MLFVWVAINGTCINIWDKTQLENIFTIYSGGQTHFSTLDTGGPAVGSCTATPILTLYKVVATSTACVNKSFCMFCLRDNIIQNLCGDLLDLFLYPVGPNFILYIFSFIADKVDGRLLPPFTKYVAVFFLIVLKLTSLYFALIKMVSRSANTCKN